MSFEIFVGLLLIIIFSIVVERAIRNPFIIAGIAAIVSLIILAVFYETLTAVFAIWVVIYTIAAFVSAYLSDYFSRRRINRNNGTRNDNDDCF